jgi:hypothetical protein
MRSSGRRIAGLAAEMPVSAAISSGRGTPENRGKYE